MPENLAAERLQRAISPTRGYAVIVLDSDGVIEQWNRGAEEIFGYSDAEAIGMAAERLFTPGDIAEGVPTSYFLLPTSYFLLLPSHYNAAHARVLS